MGLEKPGIRGSWIMTKSTERMTEAVCDSKHTFRKAETHCSKPQKHRYNRRKVRAYLQLNDWAAAEEE